VTSLETEVKFHLSDLSSMRARLEALGARSLGRFHEHNIRFEDGAQRLSRNKMLLRLRRDRKSTLTFKSIPADADPEFKQMNEIEVEVGDFEGTRRILDCLGFQPHQVYEKWRETFRLDETAFCLDALPYGDFLEIEGPKTQIPRLAESLDLDWRRRILHNYLEIFELIRSRQNLPFSDVTFSNFSAVALDLNAYLPLLECR
jgi:adenylate cyclase class 2